jgi:MHS family shikimate/dehydroshikimate transporter-like MFS transporter
VVGLSFDVPSVSGSIAALDSELFGTHIRYTGLVFAREVSGAVIGRFTPLFATSLVLWSGGRSWPVSVCMIVTALTASLCSYLIGDIAEAGNRGEP